MISITKRIGIRPEEEIIFFLRRHWFAVLPLVFGFLFVILLPFALYLGLQTFRPEFMAVKTNFTLTLMGASIFFLYAWLFLFQNFVDWYLDVWIVTNQRIINIEQRGLFGRVMSELMLYNIQDVTSEVNGFIPSMFDYGTVHIQTAAEKSRFEFEEIEHPNLVAKRILELTSQQRDIHQEVDIKTDNK
jgi:hypothetical protein